jgi:predicted dehydrogenase
MKEKISWGIIGLGNIAHSFAKDLQLVPDGELVAVASRSEDKAREFGSQYGARHAFGSYEELMGCADVDVIYIATPHTSHAEWSVKAMDMGKHVLCEKPMGVSLDQVERMVAASTRNRVFLMEALWSRFNPSILKIKEMVDSGAIGEIGYMHADFAFPALDRSEDGRLLNPNLAGGSLLDIGIYPIFLSYLFLGFPENIKSSSRFYRTGVEIQTSMIFEYPLAQAILHSGLTTRSEMKAEIAGTKGNIFIHSRWHETQGFTMVKNGEIQNFDFPTLGKGYSHEIREVHTCLANKQIESSLWSHKNSIDLIRIMDEIRKQNGIVFPFEV